MVGPQQAVSFQDGSSAGVAKVSNKHFPEGKKPCTESRRLHWWCFWDLTKSFSHFLKLKILFLIRKDEGQTSPVWCKIIYFSQKRQEDNMQQDFHPQVPVDLHAVRPALHPTPPPMLQPAMAADRLLGSTMSLVLWGGPPTPAPCPSKGRLLRPSSAEHGNSARLRNRLLTSATTFLISKKRHIPVSSMCARTTSWANWGRGDLGSRRGSPNSLQREGSWSELQLQRGGFRRVGPRGVGVLARAQLRDEASVQLVHLLWGEDQLVHLSEARLAGKGHFAHVDGVLLLLLFGLETTGWQAEHQGCDSWCTAQWGGVILGTSKEA